MSLYFPCARTPSKGLSLYGIYIYMTSHPGGSISSSFDNIPCSLLYLLLYIYFIPYDFYASFQVPDLLGLTTHIFTLSRCIWGSIKRRNSKFTCASISYAFLKCFYIAAILPSFMPISQMPSLFLNFPLQLSNPISFILSHYEIYILYCEIYYSYSIFLKILHFSIFK